MAFIANDRIVGPVQPADGVSLISVDFYFENEDEIEVYQNGSETPLTLGDDYTVTLPSAYGVADGSITLTTPADGESFYAVYGAQPLERTSDLQFRGDLRSPVLNLELDRLWRAITDVGTLADRTLRFSRAADIPLALETFSDAERIGKVIGFSGDGSQLALVSIAAVTGAISLPGTSTDDALVRWHGTEGDTIQDSSVTLSDTNELAGLLSVSLRDSGQPAGAISRIRQAAAVLEVSVDPTAADGSSELRVDVDNGQRLRVGASGVTIGTGAADRDLRITGTGAVKMPSGTTAQRPGSPENGDLRYNSESAEFEGYADGAWGPIAGGSTGIFRENASTLEENTTIAAGTNALAAGPLTIDTGVTLTVNGSLAIV